MSYIRPDWYPKQKSPARPNRRKVNQTGKVAPDGYVWLYKGTYAVREQLKRLGGRWLGSNNWLIPEDREKEARELIRSKGKQQQTSNQEN